MLSIYKYKIYNPFEHNFVGNSNLKILRPTLQFDKSGYPMKRGSSFFSVYYLDMYIFYIGKYNKIYGDKFICNYISTNDIILYFMFKISCKYFTNFTRNAMTSPRN